jgi:hypothetical protein
MQLGSILQLGIRVFFRKYQTLLSERLAGERLVAKKIIKL